MDFSEKIAIVTGGARGIGRYIAEEFAKAGARVMVIDRLPQPEDWSATNFYYQGDLAEESVLADFAQQILIRYGLICPSTWSNKSVGRWISPGWRCSCAVRTVAFCPA